MFVPEPQLLLEIVPRTPFGERVECIVNGLGIVMCRQKGILMIFARGQYTDTVIEHLIRRPERRVTGDDASVYVPVAAGRA